MAESTTKLHLNDAKYTGDIPPHRRLGSRVAGWFLLFAVVGFAMLIWTGMTTQRNVIMAETVHDAVVKTDLLADAVRDGLDDNDTAKIKAALTGVVRNPDSGLASLSVFNADGTRVHGEQSRVLAGHDLNQARDLVRTVLAKGESAVERTPTHLIVVTPVTVAESGKTETVGALAIAWSLERQSATIADAVQEQIVIAALVLLGLLVILAILVNRMAGRPLRDMGAAVAVWRRAHRARTSRHGCNAMRSGCWPAP